MPATLPPVQVVYIAMRSLGAVGYLVSQNGTIDFPVLGTVQVAGMTKETLKDFIAKSLEDKKLLFDPVVTVRYLNFHITV